MDTADRPYRSAIIFEECLPKTAPAVEEPELKIHTEFDQDKVNFALAKIDKENQLEQGMETAIVPKKDRWALKTILVSGFALTAFQTIENVVTSLSSFDLLSLAWSGLFGGIASIAGVACYKEFSALTRLKKHEADKNSVEHIINSGGVSQAKPLCQAMAKSANSNLSASYDRWEHQASKTHTDKDTFELFDALVLQEQDIAAQKLIIKSASESAVLVALSPLAIVDVLLVAWRNLRLLDQIAALYGVELSYWSRMRLMRLVLMNLAFAGAAEALSDVGADLLSVDMLGRVSMSVAQGLGVGLLTARIGIKAMEMMRPLPYLSAPKPKLKDMRKQLLSVIMSKTKEEKTS